MKPEVRSWQWRTMLLALTVLQPILLEGADPVQEHGLASWYGNTQRGKLMANGHPFDPDKLTAASWSYPLGTKLRVTAALSDETEKTVVVTVTDRGPAHRLVQEGRIIDLSRAAFVRIAAPDAGLVRVSVERAD